MKESVSLTPDWHADVDEPAQAAVPASAVAPRDQHLVVPYYLLLVFIFFFFALPIVGENPVVRALRPIQLLLLLSTAWLAVEKTVEGEPFTVSWPETHAIVFFLIACALSTYTSFWPRATVEYSIALSKVVVIYFVMINVLTDRRRLRGFFWAITLGALVASYGTWSNYTNGIVDTEGRAIYEGNFANANELALSLIVVIPLTFSLLGRARLAGRAVALATMAFSIVATFLTYSRAGVLAFIAMGVAATARAASRKQRMALAAVAMIAVLTFPVYSSFWQRGDTFSNLQEDETFQDRVLSVKVGVLMFMDSPIIGNGYGASYIRFSDYAGLDFEKVAYIHNTFAQVLAETGLVGSVMFLTFFGSAVLRVNRISQAARARGDTEMTGYSGAILSSLAAFFVAALAGPFAGWWVLYYFIAMSSAVYTIWARENAGEIGP